jgi:hypothetical protein
VSSIIPSPDRDASIASSDAPSRIDAFDAAPDVRAGESAERDVEEEASGMNGNDA